MADTFSEASSNYGALAGVKSKKKMTSEMIPAISNFDPVNPIELYDAKPRKAIDLESIKVRSRN
jgi:hypothetical protein